MFYFDLSIVQSRSWSCDVVYWIRTTLRHKLYHRVHIFSNMNKTHKTQWRHAVNEILPKDRSHDGPYWHIQTDRLQVYYILPFNKKRGLQRVISLWNSTVERAIDLTHKLYRTSYIVLHKILFSWNQLLN